MDFQKQNDFGPDGIYLGDGEWMLWDDFGDAEPDLKYDRHLERLEAEDQLRQKYPRADALDLRQFLRLLNAVREYNEETGRHLLVYGALGELYGAVKLGIRLHANSQAKGSDGRLGNDFVEIKTIGPRSGTDRVAVHLTGRNFSKLLVVKIRPDFTFAARLIDRKAVTEKTKGRAGIAWPRACEIGTPV